MGGHCTVKLAVQCLDRIIPVGFCVCSSNYMQTVLTFICFIEPDSAVLCRKALFPIIADTLVGKKNYM